MAAKYERIKQDIISEIQSGQFQPGDKLYSESELKRKYDVSSITAVKALQELVNEGYVVRYQGKGTFVSKRKRRELIQYTDLEHSPAAESVTVLDVALVDPDELPAAIDAQAPYVAIVRIKKNGGVPYNYITSYVAADLIDPAHRTAKQLSSVYDRVAADSGLDLLRQNFRQTVSVVYPVDGDIAEALSITDGPAIKQVMFNYAADGRLLEFTTSYKRWDYYTVLFESPTIAQGGPGRE
ncbi:GntR family transcriptional regulator [Lacticaseibacillus absianus]|uniref:GntR family transcriptional regulator n=1 Tax=Lacticaseibacillus absianus TaxID=2729623 RepID=UPI0015C7370E|nr:GntR family transcriptional regulator [Lacticaseibacillus absianus]